MTPKEKCDELIKNYQIAIGSYMNELILQISKRCALISVDEVINILPKTEYLEDVKQVVKNRELEYWQSVKSEIEKL